MAREPAREKSAVRTTSAKTPTRKKSASKPGPAQRALVVGVSAYPPPVPKLPGAAADVRAIAKLLGSRNGSFPSAGVAVVAEANATQKAVLAALRKAFSGAKAED